jgi:hypothetical protein
MMSQMAASGVKIVSATVGEAEEPRMIGKSMVTMIPQKIVLKSPDATFTQESSLLGVSPDKGKTWAFLDLGTVTEAQFAQVVPELAGKITIPAKKPPVIEKTEQGAAPKP